ncbi:hypothetical protein KC571_02920, partial [candidate division WWE3 bacterium]|nr:hypothetical protein [candidate division WWE3 bacterium]
PNKKHTFNYVALGDSYTVGEAVHPLDSWPAQLTQSLLDDDFDINLIATIAQSGWTTLDLVEQGLPQFEKLEHIDLVTIQIGTNDWVKQVNASIYRQRLGQIMDTVLESVPEAASVIVLTLPDFSASPNGYLYAHGRDIPSGIQSFNQIIQEEAGQRGISIVDVFTLSQGMHENPQLVAADSLHPSAEEYALWVEKIKPSVIEYITSDQ